VELRLLNLLLLLIWAGEGVSWTQIRTEIPQYARVSQAAFRKTFFRDLLVLKARGIEVEGYFDTGDAERGKKYAI
jgi:hypothetical protein